MRRKLLTLWVVGVVVLLLVQPVAAQNPFGAIGDAITQAIANYIKGGIEWLVDQLRGLLILLYVIPRPASVDSVVDAWSKSFEIFAVLLLPLSIVVLALMNMFSSEPTELVLANYLKKILFAAGLAYFSFTIIDADVWITNGIAYTLLRFFVPDGNALAVVYGKISAALGTLAAIVYALPVLAPIIFLALLGALLIIVVRVMLVYVILILMPILCFFVIIGDGVLRPLREFVERAWSLALVLPILSVFGSVIVGLMAVVDVSTLTKNPFAGFVMLVGPLFLVYAYPSLTTSMMGMFGAVGGAVLDVAHRVGYHVGVPLGRLRSWVGRTAGAGLATGWLYTSLPTPVAAKVHDKLVRLGEGFKAIFGGRAGSIPRPTGSPRVFDSDVGRVLSEIGGAASAFGALALRARTGVKVHFRDVAAPALLVSRDIGMLAKRGHVLEFKHVLSRLYGTTNLREIYERMIRDNLEVAKATKDRSLIGLSALLSGLEYKLEPIKAGDKIVGFKKIRDVEESISNLKEVVKNPEVLESLRSGNFAKSFISSIMGEGGWYKLLQGDERAIREFVSKSGDLAFEVAPYNNTFQTLLMGGEDKAIASALIRDLTDAERLAEALAREKVESMNIKDEVQKQKVFTDLKNTYYRDVIRMYSVATGLPEERITQALEDVRRYGGGVHPLDIDSVREVVEALKSDPTRAIATLGKEISEKFVGLRIGESERLSEEQLIASIRDFLLNGGYVKGEFTGADADFFRKIHSAMVRRGLSRIRIRDDIKHVVHQVHREQLGRVDPTLFDPDYYYEPEYKAYASSLEKWMKGYGF